MIVRRFMEWIDAAPAPRRAEAAHALARSYLHSDLNIETREAMEAAMTVLLDDPANEVRLALADAIATSPDAPRHVILALAADQADIAELTLALSPVFLDAELIEMLTRVDDRLAVAIAGRDRLSASVAGVIAERSGRAVCLALAANPDATPGDHAFKRLAERFGDDAAIRAALVERADLPVDVRHMLMRSLAGALGALVDTRAWVSTDRANELARESCERATLALTEGCDGDDLVRLVRHLRESGQLTAALLLRSLCDGATGLFETTLAELAGVPRSRVERLVAAGRLSALRALYLKAGLPPVAFEAFAEALDAAVESGGEWLPGMRYRLARRLSDRVLANYPDSSDAEMTALVAMVRRFTAETARAAARDYVDECVMAA